MEATHSPCSEKSITILYKRKSNNSNNITNNNNTINSWWAHHNSNSNKTFSNQLTATTTIIAGLIKIITISNNKTPKDILVNKTLFFSTQEIKTIIVISFINSHKLKRVKRLVVMKLLSLPNILYRQRVRTKRIIILDSLLIKSVLSSPRLHKPPNSKPAWAPQQISPVSTPVLMLSATMPQGQPHLSIFLSKTEIKWVNQSNNDFNKSLNWKT